MNEIEILKKELLHKSRHRGCKEMDILLGNFATKYIDELTIADLYKYKEILLIDDQTLYAYIAGNESLDNLNNNDIIQLIAKTIK